MNQNVHFKIPWFFCVIKNFYQKLIFLIPITPKLAIGLILKLAKTTTLILCET